MLPKAFQSKLLYGSVWRTSDNYRNGSRINKELHFGVFVCANKYEYECFLCHHFPFSEHFLLQNHISSKHNWIPVQHNQEDVHISKMYNGSIWRSKNCYIDGSRCNDDPHYGIFMNDSSEKFSMDYECLLCYEFICHDPITMSEHIDRVHSPFVCSTCGAELEDICAVRRCMRQHFRRSRGAARAAKRKRSPMS